MLIESKIQTKKLKAWLKVMTNLNKCEHWELRQQKIMKYTGDTSEPTFESFHDPFVSTTHQISRPK